MKRILTFFVLLMRGAIRPAPVIDGQQYRLGIWSSITLAWALSYAPAFQEMQWLPTQLRRIGHFLKLVWRPCQSDEHGNTIYMSIACAWSIASIFADIPTMRL